MTWSYGIYKTANNEFTICEVYRDEKGKEYAHSGGRVAYGDTPEDLLKVLKMMKKDIKKSIKKKGKIYE